MITRKPARIAKGAAVGNWRSVGLGCCLVVVYGWSFPGKLSEIIRVDNAKE